MRNLVLLLLLANIVFLAWNQWVAAPPGDAAIRFAEDDLEQSLEIAPAPGSPPSRDAVVSEEPEPESMGDEVADEPTASATAAATDDETAEPVVAAVCVSVGPFESEEDADDAVERLAGLAGSASRRSEEREVFLGHWVQIRNIADREESARQLAILQDNGIADAYPVPEDDGERTISIGLFNSIDRAERLLADVRALGLEPEIVRHTEEGTLYWADARLDTGEALTAVEQRFGADNILAGSEARCPTE